MNSFEIGLGDLSGAEASVGHLRLELVDGDLLEIDRGHPGMVAGLLSHRTISHRPRGAPAMAAVRQANVTWSGDLVSGKGNVTAVTSGVFKGLEVSWARRSEADANGVTSPEELLAAAHAACYAMAFSAGLARAGTKPDQLNVTA